MLHPADKKNHKVVGIVFGLVGVIVLALTVNPDRDFGDPAPAALIIGGFFLACSVAYLAVHAWSVLLRDHELWRRSLDDQ